MYIASNVGTETDDAIMDFRARCKAMREEGAVKWAGIELGPEPPKGERPDEDATQRSDRLEVLKTEREQRLRFGTSGGPRPLARPR